MGSKLEVTVGLNAANYNRGLAEMRAGAAKFKSEIKGMFAGAAGPVALLAGAVMTFKRAIDKASEMEGFQTAFKTILGSMDAAKSRMKELSDFAASTPFELPEVANASKTLQTLTDGALAVGDGLRIVGDAAATAQRPFSELAVTIGRVYAGAMAGSNTIGAEINRLVELGLVSVTTKNKLSEMMEAGKKGGEVWAVVAKDLERFKGQMEAMSGTLEGKMSTLGDAWDELLRRFAKPLLPNVKEGADEMTSFMGSLGVLADILGQSFKGLFAYIAGGIDLTIAGFRAMYEQLAGLAKSTTAISNKSAGNEIAKGQVKAGEIWNRAVERSKKRFTNGPDEPGAGASGPQDAGVQAESNILAAEEEKELKKREDRLQKIREAEADAAREALEGQEKINALIAERDRLLEEYKSGNDDDKALDALEKAQKLQRDIESEGKKQDEERTKREDDIAKKKAEEAEAEVERAARIAAARKDEAQTREDDIIGTLSGDDKLKALQTKLDRMKEEAALLEESDPAAAAQLRSQMVGVNAEMRGERKNMADANSQKVEDQKSEVDKANNALTQAKSKAASVPVDSLQAVGGGRGNIAGGDAMIRAAEKQVNLQEQILNTLQAQFGKNEPKKDPFYDR